MRRIIYSILLILICQTLGANKIKVSCIGDSITYGLTIEDREKDSYPSQLQRLLGDSYLVGNFGKSGATLLRNGHRDYCKQEEFAQAMDFAGDIVVIHLGINDTDPRDWPHYGDEFVRDYLALIDTLRSANPSAKFYIARLTPISDRHKRFESGTRDWHREIQSAIASVAKISGANLFDLHAPLYSRPDLFPDGLHPNPQGAGIIARTVYSAITGDFGGLKLAPIYNDGLVLQRGKPFAISGIANAGETVRLRLSGLPSFVHADASSKNRLRGRNCVDIEVVAGSDGKWSAAFPALATAVDCELRVETKDRKLKFKDVAVGEVWLCGGQSNMEFALRGALGAEEDIALSDNELLRFFDMKANWRTDAVEWSESALDSLNALQHFAPAKWEKSTPASAAEFSAVAYYFGKMLQDSLQVPVGLICNAVGGSPAEAWVSREAMEFEFPAALRDWTKNDFAQDWVRGRAQLNMAKSANPLQRHPYQPCYLFESGIQPLEQFPIAGVIWYQGESNAHNVAAHNKLFKLLVSSWREYWKSPQLPFYYVQLSSMGRPSWPGFRNGQRELMDEIAFTAMAVSSDVGNPTDVHPRNKRPVGERLARWALHNDYGYKDLVPSGPLFKSVEYRDGSAWVSFDYGQGLGAASSSECKSVDISGFEIAEFEGYFFPAQAEVVGEQIRLSCPEVRNPRYVRYGWQPVSQGNLTNAAGLPASTFVSASPDL